ncbi:MAG: hypothetical protein JW739_08645 [Opitutales bacterium]|nr:hypothetical protein [Opitutales bacterium]
MKTKPSLQTAIAIPAYLWAIGACLCTPILFLGLGSFAHNAAGLPFMQIHPRYSGGTILREETVGGVVRRIYEPVFKGLIKERNTGIQQVDLVTPSPHPAEQAIDLDADGRIDLKIRIAETGQPEVIPLSENITGLQVWAKTEEGWIIRIQIEKTSFTKTPEH